MNALPTDVSQDLDGEAPTMRRPNPLHTARNLFAAAIVGASAHALLIAAGAAAQSPPGAPQLTPVQAPPPAPLPPAASELEKRFRELRDYVRNKGFVDTATRGDAERLATALDARLGEPGVPQEELGRLLPARALVAVWLADTDAIDAAFGRMLKELPSTEAVALAYAKELNADARFAKTLDLLRDRQFTTESRQVDAKIAMGDALLGLNRFEDAQSQYNTAPAKGRSPAQMEAIAAGTRRVLFGRYLFNKELGALVKDQQKGDLPVVELATTRGPVLVELFEDQAPNTVGNFIEHIEAGTYDGTSFHRFMRGFGIQGGDPATASGGEGGRSTGGWVIPDENERTDRRSPAVGRLVMAKLPAGDSPVKPAQNSSGCQFTILTGPAESLDGFYTVFGRVIEGIEHVQAMREGDQIVRATVISKRARDYKGVRLGKGAGGVYSMPRPGIPLTPAQSGDAGF
jgi:peptidylprolyl isomerase/peptidyl-prolyl cis-trans isomerase B (cyclophilin B)